MEQQEKKSGFYYIGSQSPQITQLVSVFRHGYAFDDPSQAIRELTHEEHLLPEVIICEPFFGLAEITRLSGFLAHHPTLKDIPFILDAKGMEAGDCNQYIQNQLADDMLPVADCGQSLLERKVRFLQQCKIARQELDKKEIIPARVNFREPLYEFLKRSFDVFVALFLLLLFSPVFMIISLAIAAESAGPVIYTARRAGKGYRIFNFYKFRTMYKGAEEQMPALAHLNQYGGSRFFKVKNDPRVTRIGRFLRNTSLDELPQLINVLRGDMAIVGNRPLPLYEAKTLTTDELAKRFLAPAGITGLWQVRRRGMEQMNEEERIGLDIDYADRSGFLYDLWIMANTANVMVQKANV
ncbi:MAG TPA: sugar transferase [Puia sp.]|nr:sugar transferase [Puia sp.]